MLDAINTHGHPHTQNQFAVIPTAEKLKADTKYSGRGITVAFLDSGFYPHPDFIDRVVAFHDVSGEEKSLSAIAEPKGHHWHGTQTVVSCAGDGSLSDNIYHGLAHDCELVLVKVSEQGQIGDESIERGLAWVIENREKYNIRVLNMSLGGDADVPTAESRINQLAEELVCLGVVITVAAGNSSASRPVPPATAPSVITVGGYSDENQFDVEGFDLYHSNFGATVDGLIKPELVAPAMFVAAPILPATADYEAAETLTMLASAPDYRFPSLLKEHWQQADLEPGVLSLNARTARDLIADRLRRRKVVSTHYQHVDGTSFAAPITASVVAQMLEANPALTPPAIKHILISTATKLAGHSAVRQGFGVLNAKLAVEKALSESHYLSVKYFSPPRVAGMEILFFHHDDQAESVTLAGDFNEWDPTETQCAKNAEGVWQAEINCLPSGKYRYKYFIDGERWTEDISHGLKEEDGFGGFNSLLVLE